MKRSLFVALTALALAPGYGLSQCPRPSGVTVDPTTGGALVTKVDPPPSAASNAGVQVGNVITAVEVGGVSRPITDQASLNKAVKNAQDANGLMPITVVRNGQTLGLTMVVDPCKVPHWCPSPWLPPCGVPCPPPGCGCGNGRAPCNNNRTVPSNNVSSAARAGMANFAPRLATAGGRRR